MKRKLEALNTLRPARTLKKHGDVWVLEICDYRALYLIDEKARTRTVFSVGTTRSTKNGISSCSSEAEAEPRHQTPAFSLRYSPLHFILSSFLI